jgi:hypothetical protein
MGPGNAAFECSQHEELNIYIQITVESRYPDTEQFVRFGTLTKHAEVSGTFKPCR